jgi:CRISPR-associated protein (TIGR02584 family)
MRDVLVAVCGLTPQVVTETLWALHRRSPPIHPSEIWILTTRAGRDECLRTLLGPKGALARYVREYRPDPVPSCRPNSVILLKTADGALLDDVRSERDNRAVADQIAEFIRKQTNRAETRLHCSVAGGRKTMGVLLAAALQLYGRPDDRLYHVLVSPEFESHRDFFYPPKRPRMLRLTDGRRLDARTAAVELAELPYVRLRGLLDAEHLTAQTTLSAMAATAQRRLELLVDPEPVQVHPTNNLLRIGSNRVALSPAGMTIYRALARTKRDHCVRPDLRACGDCMDCYVRFTKDAADETKAILEERGGGPVLRNATDEKDLANQFRSLIRKVNGKLERSLGMGPAENPYRIRSGGARGETVYGLALDKTKILIAEGPESGGVRSRGNVAGNVSPLDRNRPER